MFEGGQLTKPNFYKGKEVREFIPDQFVQKYCQTEYGKNLLDYVKNLSNCDKLPENYPEGSDIHPFLEKSGSLRTEVPMPESKGDFIALFTIILAHEKNSDTYRVDSDGFQNMGFMDPLLGDFRIEVDGHEVSEGNETKRRQILIWEDACGFKSKIGKGSPNFYILLCSILLQINDQKQFGIRGRYGEPTMRRLKDGFAHEEGGADPNLMLSTIWINKETGIPYGFYNTGFYNNYNTLFLNFTFLVDKQDVIINGARVKPTSYTVALSAAFYSQRFNILATDMNVIIHTDKMLAALSTAGFLQNDIQNEKAEAICRNCFDQISPGIVGQEKPFSQIFPARHFAKTIIDSEQSSAFDKKTATRTSMVYFVDQSTVPPFDPGEEVPNPNDLYYKILYQTYVNILREADLATIPRSILINGHLDDQHIEEIANHTGKTQSQILEWLQHPDSLHLKGGTKTAILDKHRTVNANYNINSATAYKDFNPDCMKKRLEIVDNNVADKFGKVAGEIITVAAKSGNTGNQEITLRSGRKFPRLTEIAIFMVGSLDAVSKSSSVTPAWERALKETKEHAQKKDPR